MLLSSLRTCLCLLLATLSALHAGAQESSRPLLLEDRSGWWAQADARQATILRTEDGGARWQEVSPPLLAQVARRFAARPEGPCLCEALSLSALDAQQCALTLVPPEQEEVLLLQTRDAGRSWQERPVPGPAEAAYLSLVEPQSIFLLIVSGGGRELRLQATTDGGEHWQKLSLPSQRAFAPTGLTFRDRKAGWLTGVPFGGETVPLYRTADGGRSWQKQELPFRAGTAGESPLAADVYPPRFSGPGRQEGELRVHWLLRTPAGAREQRWQRYRSGDGGLTWAPAGE